MIQNAPRSSGLLPTQEERRVEDERKRTEIEKEANDVYKKRQLSISENANKLAKTNIILTAVVALLAAVTGAATWYQGAMNKRNWETASSTLAQMQRDAAESSQQFQVQLGHYDAGLGRTGLLAAHAGEQASETRSLAQTSRNALVSVQRAFVFPSAAFVPVYVSGNSGELKELGGYANVDQFWRDADQELRYAC